MKAEKENTVWWFPCKMKRKETKKRIKISCSLMISWFLGHDTNPMRSN